MKIESVFNPRLQLEKNVVKENSATPTADFGDLLKSAIKEVNQAQHDADDKISGLLKGETKDIHATVLAVQQADSSFKMMMNIRNKIVEAYREISKSGI